MDILSLLIGFPLGIFSNISTEIIERYTYNSELGLKKLFVKSLFKAIKEREKHADNFSKKQLKIIKNKIEKNNEILFSVINDQLGESYRNILCFRKKNSGLI